MILYFIANTFMRTPSCVYTFSFKSLLSSKVNVKKWSKRDLNAFIAHVLRITLDNNVFNIILSSFCSCYFFVWIFTDKIIIFFLYIYEKVLSYFVPYMNSNFLCNSLCTVNHWVSPLSFIWLSHSQSLEFNVAIYCSSLLTLNIQMAFSSS